MEGAEPVLTNRYRVLSLGLLRSGRWSCGCNIEDAIRNGADVTTHKQNWKIHESFRPLTSFSSIAVAAIVEKVSPYHRTCPLHPQSQPQATARPFFFRSSSSLAIRLLQQAANKYRHIDFEGYEKVTFVIGEWAASVLGGWDQRIASSKGGRIEINCMKPLLDTTQCDTFEKWYH